MVLNFAASDVLLAQIAKGAPADVFASADEIAMDKAVSQNVIDTKTRTLVYRDNSITLTKREFQILAMLIGRPEKYFTAEQLLIEDNERGSQKRKVQH